MYLKHVFIFTILQIDFQNNLTLCIIISKKRMVLIATLMKKTIYKGKLTWVGDAATSTFWDSRWEESVQSAWQHAKVPRYLNHYLSNLSKGSRILEAGCGNAAILKAIIDRGYAAEGVDYAENTVAYLAASGLPVKLMDVRSLEYEDSIFQGYISLGVIEHFIDEEESLQILKEAIRITEPGARIFCSVPYTNRIREPYLSDENYKVSFDKGNYYQRSYTLDQYKSLIKDLPVKIAKVTCYDSVKGIADEAPRLHWLKRRPYSYAIRLLDQTVSLNRLYGHMIALELINNK